MRVNAMAATQHDRRLTAPARRATLLGMPQLTKTVATQVSLTDGSQGAEPISFFTVVAGKITKLVEYWPEPFAPAQNRRHLTDQLS